MSRSLLLPIGLAVAGVLVASAGTALAQPPGAHGQRPPHARRGPPPIERVLERHAERIGLDEQTQADIREIGDATRDESRALHETLHGLREQLHGELSQSTPDEAAIMQLAERIGAAETELRKLRLRSMLRIRALLTDEQRAELVKIHAERLERGPPHRDGWGGPKAGTDRVD